MTRDSEVRRYRAIEVKPASSRAQARDRNRATEARARAATQGRTARARERAIVKKPSRFAHLYKMPEWCHPKHGLRIRCLVRDGFACQRCQRVEHSSRLHGHHRVPHKGDLKLFLDPNNVQTMCEQCHNTEISGEERTIARRGYSDACDADGYPTDPRHPFNWERQE
jgi:5-methylcytosine-specific restriction endonuclease McrA